MDLEAFRIYCHHAFRHLPWEQWLMIIALSVFVAWVLKRVKGFSGYATVAFGCAVLFGLYMLGDMVLRRIGIQIDQHPELNLVAEYHRFFQGDAEHRAFMLFNVLVFIPLGFALSEFLSVAKQVKTKRNIGLVALVAGLLSLCIESLQWILRVGLFELTDIVLNTTGAVVGALLALGLRRIISNTSKRGVLS